MARKSAMLSPAHLNLSSRDPREGNSGDTILNCKIAAPAMAFSHGSYRMRCCSGNTSSCDAGGVTGVSRCFFNHDDYVVYRTLLAEGCRAASVEVWAYCLISHPCGCDQAKPKKAFICSARRAAKLLSSVPWSAISSRSASPTASRRARIWPSSLAMASLSLRIGARSSLAIS